ncbi:MAG: GAF domain-containing protein [Sterolibacterium sp.]
MTPTLRSLRRCFEGAVPATIATCAADGMPNVAKLSHVHFVDDEHVALSYQFFNKTRENILHNHHATVEVVDPVSAAHYCLRVEFLRTETAGPLFEYMKARLAAIASHTGMSKVFRLLGSDIYRVLEVEAVPGDVDAEFPSRANLLSGLRACQNELAGCAELARLLDAMLEGLERHWDIRHSMLLMADPDGRRLYTVTSRGYAESGVGSEVRMGEGIVGVAAGGRTPIRIGYAVQEYRYSQATRQRFAASADGDALETEIPFPGLAEAGSQLAVPLLLAGRLLGVLLVESPLEQRFTYEDEDALVVLGGQLAMCIDMVSRNSESPAEPEVPGAAAEPARGAPVLIRHFPADHSVFVDNDYLIKGVAGAIFWKLLREHTEAGRAEFTNRELRLDASLGLPDITDNLDARLILLQRRLAERCSFIAIEKTGRGRFRLKVGRPLQLSLAAAL